MELKNSCGLVTCAKVIAQLMTALCRFKSGDSNAISLGTLTFALVSLSQASPLSKPVLLLDLPCGSHWDCKMPFSDNQ